MPTVHITKCVSRWREGVSMRSKSKGETEYIAAAVPQLTQLYTAVLSEAWAKLREWAILAGKGQLLLSGSVVLASLKAAVHMDVFHDLYSRIVHGHFLDVTITPYICLFELLCKLKSLMPYRFQWGADFVKRRTDSGFFPQSNSVCRDCWVWKNCLSHKWPLRLVGELHRLA